MRLRNTSSARRLRGEKKFRWCCSSSRCFSAIWRAPGAARSSIPTDILRQRLSRATVHRRGRGMRRADGLHRRRRAAGAQGDRRRSSPRWSSASGTSILCTNALLLEKKLDSSRRRRTSRVSIHIDGLRERHDESVCRDGRVRQGRSPRSQRRRRRGFRVTTNTTFFDQDDAERDPRRARLPQRRGRGRQHADLAGLRL